MYYECKMCGWSIYDIEKEKYQCPDCGAWIYTRDPTQIAKLSNNELTHEILITRTDLNSLQKSLQIIITSNLLGAIRENLIDLKKKIDDLTLAYPDGFKMDLPITRQPNAQERYLLRIEDRKKGY